jgi:DNA-directed RNA polymerase subunit RPC12/RpoP
LTTNEKDLTVKVFDSCPHCGHELSPWEKVLLSVDRALMCKYCWYRIILSQENLKENQIKDKNKKKE